MRYWLPPCHDDLRRQGWVEVVTLRRLRSRTYSNLRTGQYRLIAASAGSHATATLDRMARLGFDRADYPALSVAAATFYSTTGDGVVWHNGSNYATVHSAATGSSVDTAIPAIYVGQALISTTYWIYRMFFYFDTSTIPANATIDAATFYFRVDYDDSVTDFDITVVQGTQGATLAVEDYDACGSTSGGSVTTVGISTTAYSSITLNATGRGFIVKAGTTKLALRSSRDISATAPFESEQVHIRMADYDGTASDPYLDVTYTTGVTFAGSAAVAVGSTGALAATKVLAASGTVAVNSSGALAATKVLAASGAVAVNSSGALAATKVLAASGAVAVNSSGALAATKVLAASGTVTVGGSGLLVILAVIRRLLRAESGKRTIRDG